MKIHNHRTKSFVSYILLTCTLLCMLTVSLHFDAKQAEASSSTSTQIGCITYGTVGVYFRQTPGGNQIKHNGVAIQLNGGHPLEILDTSNKDWYKVRLIYQGATYVGYVASQYVYFLSSPATTDTTFEKMIEDFPDSYKPQLRELHAKHPNWVFNPVKTGLEWKTVVANEVNTNKSVKNTVEGTSSYPRYNWRSTTVGYDYATDKYKAYDGSTWFAASDALVTYYLDPRIYLSEKSIFAFEALTYDPAQTTDGVEAILNGSFMYKNKPADSTSNYSTLMVQAGKAAGVSPYHIASRIRQEVGSTNGSVTNGKHSKYPGIYNFYNIGGYDSSSGDAPTLALQWASQKNATYGRPWNSVYKSLYGGALYIGEKFIFRGQNTLYTQKFNVTNKSDGLYSHQYMTNVQAVESESAKVYTAYSGAKMLDNPIVFLIPVYNNMPGSISVKPADSGSPNNWLKTLTVSGYSLDFKPATTNYTFSVPASVSSITIGATTVNSKAKVSGTGTISLKTGTNTINIAVTAQNGAKRTYTLTVTKGSDPAPAVVKNVKTTPGDNSITVSWDAVSGANGYRVYRYDDNKKTWVVLTITSACSYKDTGVTAGVTYKYAVRAYKTVNGTTYLSPSFVTVQGLIYLKTVTGINATAGTNGITISWSKVTGAEKYRVYYKTGTGNWTKIADTTATSYNWKGAKAGTTYTFTVRCINSTATSFTSDFDKAGKTLAYVATPKLSNVSNVTGGVQIKWGAVSGAVKYRVYYKTGSGSWTRIADTTGTSYTWSGAKSGTTYAFTVRCINSDATCYTSSFDTTGMSVKYISTPKLSSVSNVTGGVQVKWGAVSGAEKYRVYYKTGSGNWTRIADTTGTSYTWNGAKVGTTYTFTVRCINSAATSFTSDFDNVGKTLTYYIATPKLSSVSNVTGGVQVKWGAVAGAEKYRVYYKTGSGSWTRIVDTTETSYTWSGAKSGTTYTFTVRCINSNATIFTSNFDSTGKTIVAK